MESYTSYQESCQHLKKAALALESFTREKLKQLRKCVRALFSKRTIKQLIDEEESLLSIIDVIKKNRTLIQKLQKGTQEEQKLAQAVLHAISQYNHHIAKLNHKAHRFKKLLPEFLTREMPAPVFPNRFPIELSLPITSVNERKILSTTSYQLSKQEIDAFYMKGITLLNLHGNPFPSIAQTQAAVRSAPIHVDVNKQETTISLTAVLEPLPKEKYILKGSFKVLPNWKKQSIPLRKSFKLGVEITQNGFYHPSQYLSCFADPMVPPCPHRPDQLPCFFPFLTRKNEMMHALHPKGAFNQKAKERIEERGALYDKHKDILLPLHQELLSHLEETTDHDSYEELVAHFQAFSEEHVEKLLLESSELTDSDSSPLPQACRTIILQHLSENAETAPPTMDPFTTKVQTLLYRQLLAFFNELERENPLTLEDLLREAKADLAIFTGSPTDSLTKEALAITKELEHYFIDRSTQCSRKKSKFPSAKGT